MTDTIQDRGARIPPMYERLGDVDRQFLAFEGPASHMHIAGAAVFEGGALRNADGALDFARIRRYVETRLPRIPRYRQVLSYTPFGRPIWLDDPHFNIGYHVRHTALPRPGTIEQFKALCGRVFSQALDRGKPLWELWIVDGIDGRDDRFGFISKVHHAMVDGVRSIDLLEAVLTTEPLEDFGTAPPWLARRRPSPAVLMLDDLSRLGRAYLDLALQVPSLAYGALQARSDVRLALRGVVDLSAKTLRRPTETPFNHRIGPHRRFEWIETDLADVKAIRRAYGGSLNDVVLATVAGGVGRFLAHRGINPTGFDFRVMAPVSVAARTGTADTLGNQVSAWMVPLPIDERDPKRRLEIVQRTTTQLKEEKNALGMWVWGQVAALAPATLTSLAAQTPWRSLPFNMVVTNVPGPQRPLYLLGARMQNYFGTLPLSNYLGLASVIVSYAGTLSWGFPADWDLVPDVDVFAACIEAAFRELRDAASGHGATVAISGVG